MGTLINVTINGAQTSIQSNTSIRNIIKSYSLNPNSIIVEINETIIEKKHYNTTILNENDSVELIRYIGGGACPTNNQIQ